MFRHACPPPHLGTQPLLGVSISRRSSISQKSTKQLGGPGARHQCERTETYPALTLFPCFSAPQLQISETEHPVPSHPWGSNCPLTAVIEFLSFEAHGQWRRDVLCTDKTGTLTVDEVTLLKALDMAGQDSLDVLRLAYANSRFQVRIQPFTIKV